MAGRLAAILALVFALTGCQGIVVSRGGVRGFLPEIPAPTRPVLKELTPEETLAAKTLPPAVLAKVQANVLDVQKYAKQLEVSIEEYNAYAKVNNRLARQELGLKPKEEVKP
jgi:hypothetical protein